MFRHHAKLERNVVLLIVGIVLTVAIGGLVEIVPLFTIDETIEPVEGVRPYAPLELTGRNIYVREGCYVCHSQQVRPFRDEVERYGHYSLAAESLYDRPFQWGSKRTGPDLARVGGKYTNQWHAAHMTDPRAVVPESIMPGYPALARTELGYADMAAHLATLRALGVPYDDAMVANAVADIEAQASADADAAGLIERYPGATAGDFDGDPARVTELDALIAYLQVLGRMVDFTTYRPEYAAPGGG